MSEKAKLVAAVLDLYQIGQRLHHRYQDDVSPNRADDMVRLYEQLAKIAQPIIDSHPYGYGHKYLQFKP